MKKNCPIVFVHGLGGWGQGALLDTVMPHWGMRTGSMRKHLGRRGYEACAAAAGPVSGTWDRACELYAHLTGTRVDYGQAHARAYGHERYGGAYKKALLKDWSKDRPIALLGHSYGGAAVRLFAQLCEQGSAAEQAAGQEGLSPLFTGELKGRILAVVTLAAPHNGTTAAESQLGDEGSIGGILPAQMMALARAGMVLPFLERIYPFHLRQFGVSAGNFYRRPANAWRAPDAFMAQEDCAGYELSIDGAKALNESISCQPGIYYFSYTAQITEADAAGNQVPGKGIWRVYRSTSAAMGKRRPAFTTPGGVRIDDTWLPNDGLINLVSARYPFNEPHKPYGTGAVERGIWQVMPTMTGFDHGDFCGGVKRPGGVEGCEAFYLGVAGMLERLAN